MPCSRLALGALLLLGVVSAWTPNHRPVTTPKQPATKQPAFLDDFRPVHWAAAGFMAASLAFTPLPTHAADAPVADPPTEVKVDVDTDKLIKSIEENKGELNAAVSSVVKDTPSESIELTPPPSKADAVSEALNAGKEPAVQEEPKTEAPKAEVKEEPKAEAPAPAPAPVAPAPVTPESKTEAPKPVETKEEPKPAEAKKEEPKPVETKKEEPKPVEEPKAATQPAEPAAAAPKEESKVEPEKEPVAEAPKTAIVVQPPKQDAAPQASNKAPTLFEFLKGLASGISTPPVATQVKPAEPAAKVEAPKLELPKPELPKLEPSKEVTKVESATTNGFEKVLDNLVAPFRETKEEATKTNFDDVAFWERPAIRTALLSPDGTERLNLVFTNGEVATGVGLVIFFSYLTSYQLSSSSDSEGDSPKTEEKKDSPSIATTTPAPYSGSSYIDRLASTQNAPPKPQSSKPKFPAPKVTSDSSIAGARSYTDSLSKTSSNKPPPKQQPKFPRGGGSYLDSL